jgi:hypothetical protein
MVFVTFLGIGYEAYMSLCVIGMSTPSVSLLHPLLDIVLFCYTGLLCIVRGNTPSSVHLSIGLGHVFETIFDVIYSKSSLIWLQLNRMLDNLDRKVKNAVHS